eukprot:SAG22_NODE_910_length_6547_cov_2.044975_3_plen_71_part_00
MLLGQTRTARERIRREEKSLEFGEGGSARFHRSGVAGGYLETNQRESVRAPTPLARPSHAARRGTANLQT